MHHVRLLVVSLLGVCVFFVFSHTNAFAAAVSANTIRVSPALTNLQLDPGETHKTLSIDVTNLTGKTLLIQLDALDFGALNETGAVSFYGSKYKPSTNPHSLEGAISFPDAAIVLTPHQTKRVTVDINNVNKLAPGGHYGAVIFSPADSILPGTRTNVSIRSSVASLVFLATAGGGTHAIRLLPFTVGSLRFSLPVTNYLTFRNQGNTQTTPRAQLTLYDPGGHIIGTTVVNPGSGLILPGTSRLFETTLPFRHNLYAQSGMYRLKLQYKDANASTFTVVNKRFLYLNLRVVIPAAAVLVAILVVLIKYGKTLLRKILHFIIRYPRRLRMGTGHHSDHSNKA